MENEYSSPLLFFDVAMV